MRCKGCPRKKFCIDDCGNCDFGKAFIRLNNKIVRLEKHNSVLREIVMKGGEQ